MAVATELTDEFYSDMQTLLEYHGIQHCVALVPFPDDSIQLAITGMAPEQVWLLCDELAKRFKDQPRPNNG
jgi:hypothetical protein